MRSRVQQIFSISWIGHQVLFLVQHTSLVKVRDHHLHYFESNVHQTKCKMIRRSYMKDCHADTLICLLLCCPLCTDCCLYRDIYLQSHFNQINMTEKCAGKGTIRLSSSNTVLTSAQGWKEKHLDWCTLDGFMSVLERHIQLSPVPALEWCSLFSLSREQPEGSPLV